jgi:hypothetical protein
MGAAVTVSPARHELFWGRLLDALEEKQVIPIIGQELLEVADDGVVKPLVSVVARRALDRLQLGAECGAVRTLHEAAICCLAARAADPHRGIEIEDLYGAVHQVVGDPAFPVPDVLETLAGIEVFQLYVTTAADPLLKRAIDTARGGATNALQLAYKLPGPGEDLPAPLDEIARPVVYHLLGKTSPLETFALTEEDTLEFLHALQSERRRPPNLFEELHTRSLLIIGSGYSGWLTRFLLRVTRGTRMRDRGPARGFVADASVGPDDSLVQYLRHFHSQTEVFPGTPREFVRELAERWKTRSQAIRARAASADASAFPRVEPDSVFVSYASEDEQAARLLIAELDAARVPVWFDKHSLRAGMKFQQEILQAIGRCSLFIPVLSRHVLTSKKRFFFSEWNAAIEASKHFGAGRAFIVPCRIDDVPPDDPLIPEQIRAIHADYVADKGARAKFAARVRDLFREYVLEERPS